MYGSNNNNDKWKDNNTRSRPTSTEFVHLWARHSTNSSRTSHLHQRSRDILRPKTTGSKSSRRNTVLQSLYVNDIPRHHHRSISIDDDDAPSHRYSWRRWMHNTPHPRCNKRPAIIFKIFISSIILVDFCFFVTSTHPDMMTQQRKNIFYIEEGIVSTIFLTEYMLRLITITESKRFTGCHGILRFLITPPAIVDLLALSPFFVEIITGWDLPCLTYLRIFRLLRILKSQVFMRSLDAVGRVVYYNREILYVGLSLCVALVVATGLLLYYCRPPSDSPSYESTFSWLGATMYLSASLLTGQGGLDDPNDLPWYTQIIVLMTSVFSIAMFAIPASMLTWGFEAEAERCAKLMRRRQKESMARPTRSIDIGGEILDDHDTDEYSTDEEYIKIIAGESDSDDSSSTSSQSKIILDRLDALEEKIDNILEALANKR